MGITVAEKEHWKERIGKRIDQRIESMVAREDPTLIERVAKEAKEKAYDSLGIGPQQRELEAIEKQKEEIQKREHRLEAEQRAVLNGTTVERELERGGYSGRFDYEAEDAIKARAKALEADILSQSELGRKVVALEREKDNLLDTVWLATSTSQMKELWEQVNSLLELNPTALEEKALKIAPMEPE
jgi:hypothetical protein